jgi:hypothetical protein
MIFLTESSCFWLNGFSYQRVTEWTDEASFLVQINYIDYGPDQN